MSLEGLVRNRHSSCLETIQSSTARCYKQRTDLGALVLTVEDEVGNRGGSKQKRKKFLQLVVT